jgi:hypothetical protein
MATGFIVLALGEAEHYGREGVMEQNCMAARKQRE